MNYYYLMYDLAQHHKYSLTELENMIPFERDIYVELLLGEIREELANAQT